MVSKRASRIKRLAALVGHSLLFLITTSSVFIVLFIFYYVVKEAIPFFQLRGFQEFFTSTKWYPSQDPAAFGTLSIFYGSLLVTVSSIILAVPIGVVASICLSDILPFSMRQAVKPVIELLAAIPSVAFGFFALVILAPLLQRQGGQILVIPFLMVAAPLTLGAVVVVSELIAYRMPNGIQGVVRIFLMISMGGGFAWFLYDASTHLMVLPISSGANALNVSIILAIMALPTIVSVSEDALQSVGRELREASYALGATRAETMLKVILPAAGSGICAAVILGIMRVIGETMVVWMASGNAAHIPTPWYDLTQPIRTITATVAGEMGEADQVTGSARYHALFALALVLLTISYVCNLVSEWVSRRSPLAKKRKSS